ADTGLLAPDLEKLGILGVTNKTRRPGDVSIKSWSFRRGLAIDVAVIHPLISGRLSPASHTLKLRKSIVMLPPSFIPITILPQLSSRDQWRLNIDSPQMQQCAGTSISSPP